VTTSGKAARSRPGVGLDHLLLQAGRCGMRRRAGDEGRVGRGRVLVALLVEVQVAETGVQQVRVTRFPAPVQQRIERGRAVHVGETDAQHPEGIVACS
jgi:hypothetical protein